MKYLGITKGEWNVYNSDDESITIVNKLETQAIAFLPEMFRDTLSNAKLIADAGSTANKCGLLPSDLLEQRDEMLHLLIRLSHFEPLSGSKEIEQLIQKITKQ